MIWSWIYLPTKEFKDWSCKFGALSFLSTFLGHPVQYAVLASGRHCRPYFVSFPTLDHAPTCNTEVLSKERYVLIHSAV